MPIMIFFAILCAVSLIAFLVFRTLSRSNKTDEFVRITPNEEPVSSSIPEEEVIDDVRTQHTDAGTGHE